LDFGTSKPRKYLTWVIVQRHDEKLTKAPNYCFPRRYEMLTKLLDIEDRIEQSAVNIEQFRLEDYSDNEDIPDLS